MVAITLYLIEQGFEMLIGEMEIAATAPSVPEPFGRSIQSS
jgi:hypothetical protein